MLVLTVDDSDINLAIYRGVLARIEGLQVVSYSSPYAALAWAKEHRVDVAVVDYHMPELDGLSFIERFRENPNAKHALVVMITSNREPGVMHHALEAGANDFLTKPIDRIEFAARMRNLLEVAASRRQLAERADCLREEVERATSAIVAREIETILCLTRAAGYRDEVTGMHVIRVGEMCAALAGEIGLPKDECERLLMAAPMHDIGKVATPDYILLKPGPLTVQEFEVMKQHALAGYEILRGGDSDMLRCAAEIALTHHERYDGNGYPKGLKGGAIPLSGRLCSIVDVFDALTSVRPYKRAWAYGEAVAVIDAAAGSQFDPDVVDLFHASYDAILTIKARFSDGAASIAAIKDESLSRR